MVVMHYFADRLQAGPFARTYMLGYEQMVRKKSIKSRKYRGHSPSKRQNILIFHQNPSQHPISSLSACHVIMYSVYRTLSSANRRTEDLMLSGRSFIKIRNRIGPKTDPWGTPDNTGTGSEAWPSNTTFWVRPESHELIHLWVDPLIP